MSDTFQFVPAGWYNIYVYPATLLLGRLPDLQITCNKQRQESLLVCSRNHREHASFGETSKALASLACQSHRQYKAVTSNGVLPALVI